MKINEVVVVGWWFILEVVKVSRLPKEEMVAKTPVEKLVGQAPRLVPSPHRTAFGQRVDALVADTRPRRRWRGEKT